MGYFSRAGPMPANLSVGRDLTIRRKIENGRYYCAQTAGIIVLFAVRKPIIESGHHVALNPRAPEAAAEAAVYEAESRLRACAANAPSSSLGFWRRNGDMAKGV
jgi:hypothetical protein